MSPLLGLRFVFISILLFAACGDDVPEADTRDAFLRLANAVDCAPFSACASDNCVANNCEAEILAYTNATDCPTCALDCASECTTSSCVDDCLGQLNSSSRTRYQTLATCARQASCIDVELPD